MTTAYMPDTVTPVAFPAEPCRIEDCTKPRLVHRTVCVKHATRIARHGDPEFNTWTTIDDLTVDQAVEGRRLLPGMTRIECRLVALQLAARGVTVPETARILGVTERTVYRWRAARLTPGAVER